MRETGSSLKKFGMPIIEVVAGSPVSVEEAVYTDVADGTLVNSDFLNGLSVAEAKEKIMNYLKRRASVTARPIIN